MSWFWHHQCNIAPCFTPSLSYTFLQDTPRPWGYNMVRPLRVIHISADSKFDIFLPLPADCQMTLWSEPLPPADSHLTFDTPFVASKKRCRKMLFAKIVFFTRYAVRDFLNDYFFRVIIGTYLSSIDNVIICRSKKMYYWSKTCIICFYNHMLQLTIG